MHSVPAFLRYDFLTRTSYRIQTLFMLAGVVALVVPVYFIGHALQPTMAESIRHEGGHFFGFLVVGLAAQRILWAAMEALPTTLGSGIRTGTLEAFFATPVAVPTLVVSMMTYKIVWGLLEGVLLLVAGWLLGMRLEPGHLLAGGLVVSLIVLAHVPFGLMASAGILAFRSSGPFLLSAYGASVFLGGVYYPTHVIPAWIEQVSAAVPLTYGLRALRRILLEGWSVAAVANDLLILVGFIVVLGVLSTIVFRSALRYARRAGSLAQY